MKCTIVKLRRAGVAIPKYDWAREIRRRGELAIVDTRENNLNRIVKLAKFHTRFGESKVTELLYEPHLLWMSDDRFTLSGFEQVRNDGKLTDFAQSWLCDVRAE